MCYEAIMEPEKSKEFVAARNTPSTEESLEKLVVVLNMWGGVMLPAADVATTSAPPHAPGNGEQQA